MNFDYFSSSAVQWHNRWLKLWHNLSPTWNGENDNKWSLTDAMMQATLLKGFRQMMAKDGYKCFLIIEIFDSYRKLGRWIRIVARSMK